jgi:hypothetical protein
VRLEGAVPEAVKPNETELPGLMLPLYGSLVTVTAAPDEVNTPFQPLLTCWPLGHVQLAFPPVAAESPALLTVTWPWKPPNQLFVTENAHDSVAGGGVLGGGPPLPAPGSGNSIPASSDCFSVTGNRQGPRSLGRRRVRSGYADCPSACVPPL